MPYIKPGRRKTLNGGGYPVTPGELNYVITNVILDYLEDRERFQFYNEVIGVLECCKLELYRKVISKHEDKKCNENGEVYE